MPAFADINITNEALALVGTVVVTLWTTLMLMWKEQRGRDRERIARLESQVDALLRVVVRHGHIDEIPAEIPDSKIPPKQPPWV